MINEVKRRAELTLRFTCVTHSTSAVFYLFCFLYEAHAAKSRGCIRRGTGISPVAIYRVHINVHLQAHLY